MVILHPRTLVIGMLERMQGGQRLKVVVQAESAARAGAIGCCKNNTYYILLYNHRPWRLPSIPEHIDLRLKSERLQHGQWTISQWAIDKDHGVFAHRLYAACTAAGLEPLPNSPVYGGNIALRFGPEARKILIENHAQYVQLARPVEIQSKTPLTSDSGHVNVTVDMPGHSVRLIIIRRS